ncbi:SpaA isopeptide-forming pilin-related protein [Slackia heliotrinireducens]|uniref:SpaA isopeptide-forming pilin-related protein n=1 Tax=Slackia heliotrinireducens TaxID=84110 RepID=UPI00331543FB
MTKRGISVFLACLLVLSLIPGGALSPWGGVLAVADEPAEGAFEQPLDDVEGDEPTNEGEEPAVEEDPEAPEGDEGDQPSEADGEETEQVDNPESEKATEDKEANKPDDAEAQANDAMLKAPPLRAPAKPGTIETLDTASLGITMNLFDYEAVDSTSNTYTKDNNNGGGINAGKDKSNQLKFYGSGDGVSNGWNYTRNFGNPGNGINQFTGIGQSSGGQFYTVQVANQGIVQSTLTANDGTGYPLLNTNASDKSLEYLFNPDTDATGKTTNKNVNHLFKLVNTGTAQELMVYDSNENYAYYCDKKQQPKDNGDFKVYNSTYERWGGSKSGMKYGFFPFNDWGSASDCINPNESGWSPTNNPDHHLGLTMTTPLTMPLNGQITKDGETADMIFKFSGDDDMWVFIDGKLVLDIGGIHQPVSGTINFHTGEVSLGSGTSTQLDADNHPYTQSQYSYAANGIVNTNVLGDTAWLWTEDGHTGILGSRDSAENRAGTDHVLQVFYLERGGCDSNLKISTNIHLMTKKKVSVKKDWENTSTPANSAQIQLIRKAVPRDGGDPTYAAVGEPVTLNADNSWAAEWDKLPSEGYNADTVFKDGGNNKYCDYTYMVMEVPMEGYSPSYTDKDGATLTVEEITYQTIDGDEATGKVVAADLSKLPVSITNIETYIDVEKQWKDENGNVEAASVHNGDSVYVQLYKQTKTDNTWSDETPVGDPVQLNKDGWSHRFPISETGENVCYIVKEGVLDGGAFVPKTTLSTTKGSYTWQSTDYYTTTPTINGSTVTWGEETAAGTTGYVYVPENGRARAVITNAPSYITVEKQWVDADGNDETANHANDSVWVQLYKETKDAGAEWSDTLAGTAVGDPVQLKGGAWSSKIVIPTTGENTRYYVEEGTYANGAFTKATTLTTSDNKKYTWKSTTYYVGDSEDAESTDYFVIPDGETGHAVVVNEPELTKVTLLKVDADNNDPMQGVTFKLLKDKEGGANPAFDAAQDTEVVKDNLTTGSDGKVDLPSLKPGAYWLVETAAPEGYIVRDANHPIGFVVADDGSVSLIESTYDTVKTKPSIEGSDTTWTLTAKNVRAYTLPAAGGPGIYLYLLLGAFIAGLAAANMRFDWIDARRRRLCTNGEDSFPSA